jgi:hypothetical protein
MAGAAFEAIGARAQRPVGAQGCRAEEEADGLLVGEPAREPRDHPRRGGRRHVERGAALDAHEPLVASGAEVVDAHGDVDRHDAEPLDRVHEELGAVGLAAGRDRCERHGEAGGELHRAHRDEAHALGERGVETGEALPIGGGVAAELALEEDDTVPRLPGETEGDVDHPGGGVRHEAHGAGLGAHERGERGAEARALLEPAAHRADALARVALDVIHHRGPHRCGHRRDRAVGEVGRRAEVGEEGSVAGPGGQGHSGGQS